MGTLSAVARRNLDNALVFVTNTHVVSNGISVSLSGGIGEYAWSATVKDSFALDDENACVYQYLPNESDGATDMEANRVGQLYHTEEPGTNVITNSWYEAYRKEGVTGASRDGTTIADIAALKILSGVSADFGVHDPDNPDGADHDHPKRPIVAPCVAPSARMSLTCFGANTGKRVVAVSYPSPTTSLKIYTDDPGEDNRRLFQHIFPARKYFVINQENAPSQGGDSGSPVLWGDEYGNYRLVGIFFASAIKGGRDLSSARKIGYALPAQLAEELLDVTFGVKAPTAKIATPALVYPGQWFLLDGSGSTVNEPGADPLMYEWEKVEVTAQPTPIQPVLPPIGPSTSPYHNFEAPTNLGTHAYKLTVTDSNGAKHSDKVNVEVVNRPTPTPTPTPNPRPPGNPAPPLPQEAPPTPISSQWDVRYSNNKIQFKVTSLPTVNPAISEVQAYLEAGQPPNLTTVTEAIGTSLNSWVTVLSSSDTQWQTGNWAAHFRFENSAGDSSYSTGKAVTVPTTPAPPPRPRPTPTPETWGPWTDTGVREEDDSDVPRIIWKEQRRTSNRGNTETRWVRA